MPVHTNSVKKNIPIENKMFVVLTDLWYHNAGGQKKISQQQKYRPLDQIWH